MLDLANPHSIISIHINHYFPLSTNRNHHHPSFSPTLQYPISQTTHFFLIDSFYYQSFNHSQIDGSLISKQELFDSLLSLIPFLLLIRNMVIDYVSLESMNEWQGRKKAEAAAATITRVVVVNNGPIFLPMNLSTIKTYNTISFQIHRIDVESQQAIFLYKAKPSDNQMVFIFCNMLF